MGRSRARAGWAARSVPPPGRRRRGPGGSPHRHGFHGRPGAGPLQGPPAYASAGRGHAAPPFLLLLPFLLIMAAPPLLLMGWVTGGMIFPLLILVSVIATSHRNRQRQLAAQAARAAPHRLRPTAPPPRRPEPPPWQAAKTRFDALREHYAAFECDPMAVLRLPALCDVSVPSTARFVDAFAEAQALETDNRPPDPHATQFVAAVERADRAWRAAIDAAERIRLSNLSSEERGSVERIIKLLTTARDSDSEPERLAAYAKARSELGRLDRAGVIHLPKTAVAALESEARGQLPA
ncbi:DUF2786 domain-containing protein [Pseudonocardia sulfidoxydans]|nr:DUF2786 domain-containing protein [Pseudonocardia sulfidoxydans]